jgi:hypothetical protein
MTIPIKTKGFNLISITLAKAFTYTGFSLCKFKKYEESTLQYLLAQDSQQALQLIFDRHRNTIYKVVKVILASEKKITTMAEKRQIAKEITANKYLSLIKTYMNFNYIVV